MNQVTNSLLPDRSSAQDEQFRHAFDVLENGIEQRAFPGASIAITYKGNLIACKGFGHFTYDPRSSEVNSETIFDLASVTKVVATTAACMVLHQRGTLQLEQRIVEVLPEFAGEDPRRSQITFRMLLAHSSGLPAYLKLFETAGTAHDLVSQALRVPLTAAPGARAEYSDIGFILLGQALEQITGQPLDKFCRREVFDCLKFETVTFNPPEDWKSQIPPTENDLTFRHRVIQGEVNDENASVMDGVAGHAGCFSTAREVAVFAECMLHGGAPLLDLHTVEVFTRREETPAGTCRALGWDTPSPPSSSGQYFSPRSYGHLGFTGTSLWIDPERQLSVTLLTNRTWPDRACQAIRQVRPAFHDAAIEALEQ